MAFAGLLAFIFVVYANPGNWFDGLDDVGFAKIAAGLALTALGGSWLLYAAAHLGGCAGAALLALFALVGFSALWSYWPEMTFDTFSTGSSTSPSSCWWPTWSTSSARLHAGARARLARYPGARRHRLVVARRASGRRRSRRLDRHVRQPQRSRLLPGGRRGDGAGRARSRHRAAHAPRLLGSGSDRRRASCSPSRAAAWSPPAWCAASGRCARCGARRLVVGAALRGWRSCVFICARQSLVSAARELDLARRGRLGARPHRRLAHRPRDRRRAAADRRRRGRVHGRVARFAPGDAGPARTEHNTFIQLLASWAFPALSLFLGALVGRRVGGRRARRVTAAAPLRARRAVRTGRLRGVQLSGGIAFTWPLYLLLGVASLRVARVAELRAPSHRRYRRRADAARASGLERARCAASTASSRAATSALPSASAAPRAMDRAIVHRGPDDDGSYVDAAAPWACAACRSSTSTAASQPIANEDGAVWVVFNGEIYNYRELRARLLRARPPLRHRQRHRGASCTSTRSAAPTVVDALDGMFAFAIWDRRAARAAARARSARHQAALLRRDAGGLRFGSRAQVAALPSRRRRARLAAPRSRTTSRSAPRRPTSRSSTACASCRPAHLLRYRARPSSRVAPLLGPARRRRRADRRRARAAARGARARARRGRVAPGRRRAGRRVPLGRRRLGHGGRHHGRAGRAPQDLLHRLRRGRVRRARLRARRSPRSFGTDHHELVVRPDAWALIESWSGTSTSRSPTSAPSPPTWSRKLAAAHVKVVLSGDGGDEVFAGYDHYAWRSPRRAASTGCPPLRAWALARWRRRCPTRAAASTGCATRRSPRICASSTASRSSPADQGAPHRPRAAPRARRTRDHDARDRRAALLDGAPGDALGRLLYSTPRPTCRSTSSPRSIA